MSFKIQISSFKRGLGSRSGEAVQKLEAGGLGPKAPSFWGLQKNFLLFKLQPSALRPQRGDTIVEVLIALSVIGLTLAAAFGLANTAVQTGRDAQERTEALKIAESQLELTRSYLRANAALPAGLTSFCIDPAGAPIDSADPACMTIDGAGGDGLYTVVAQETAVGSGVYRFDVTWDRVNTASSEDGKVDLFYRVGPL